MCHQWRDHHGVPGAFIILRRAAYPVGVIFDDQRLERFGGAAHGALAHVHAGAGEIAAHVVAGYDLEGVFAFVVQAQLAASRFKQRNGALQDGLQQAPQLQFSRDIRGGGAQRVQLLDAILFSRIQASVFHHDGHLVSKGGCQAGVVWGVEVGLVTVNG